MKKFIINTIKFLFFASVFYVLGLFAFGYFLTPSFLKGNINYKQGGYGHLYTRLKEAKTFQDVDLLFLGSSHTYRGFDNRIFTKGGYSSFNLGSSAQTSIQTNILLKRYLDLLHPKLVVYEVYPGTFSSDGVESSLDLMSNDSMDFSDLSMALEINNLKVYNTLFYDLLREKLLTNTFVEDKNKELDTYISGGFVSKEMKYNSSPHKYKNLSRSWELKDIQFSEFEKNLEMLKKANIHFIFVYAPVTSNLYESYKNNQEFDVKMNAYAEKYHTSYINFNGKLKLNDSLHFYDAHHLNQQGVEIFNTSFIDSLKKIDLNSEFNDALDVI
ncbi:hypothetical protein SAMN04488096_101366 [Mesonia phycicola]|uniref:DUF1574 domain-containing protein n=2 Tax=Mesonia phycicola TaxID=579105 RepID=A0A1M6AP54_9FLAO|nr:hypothetical protein SAMN04488096_101366 [Mesonia phycicola]